jgi:hypothetical protein
MAVKNFRQRLVAFVAGIVLGPAVVWAGLETGTYISDLVATNPLSSDLASTADDHIRLLKSTIKTTFPNINNAITVTDEQINAVGASGVTGAANPSASVGLSAVNGSATTFMRSDGAPALSQSIAPTWTGVHTFGLAGSFASPSFVSNNTLPYLEFDESDGAANNQRWAMYAANEQLNFQVINDASSSNSPWMQVDRTGTTVDRVAFPTDSSVAFLVGPAGSLTPAYYFRSATRGAVSIANTSAVSSTVVALGIHNENTTGDNGFIEFRTEGGTGTVRGSIDYNRAGTAVRYNTSSDARLKKNFKDSPSARSVIDCIKIQSFDWKENGSHVEHGLVAQQLDNCAPDAVSKGQVWQIDRSALIPALIKYVQEQDARIARLEADAARRH